MQRKVIISFSIREPGFLNSLFTTNTEAEFTTEMNDIEIEQRIAEAIERAMLFHGKR